MSDLTGRLDAIQKRAELNPACPEGGCPLEECQIERDRDFLLDLARKQQAALDAVQTECEATDTESNEPLQTDLVTRIRYTLDAKP